MRLRVLDKGSIALRPFFGVSRLLRVKTPDIGKLFLYRPRFFGRPWGVAMQSIMRGSSEWSAGERELFAMFTSQLNHCPFWIDTHGAVASSYLGQELIDAVREDWRSAPIDIRVQAALGLIEKLTKSPDDVGTQEIDELRKAGLSNEAVRDVIYVCALMNVMDRLEHAFGFSTEGIRMGARSLRRIGYRILP